MLFVPPTPSTPNFPYQCRFLLYPHYLCLLTLGDLRGDYVYWFITFLPNDYLGPLSTRWAKKACCYFRGVFSIYSLGMAKKVVPLRVHNMLGHLNFFLFSYGAIVAPLSIASWGVIMVFLHINCMPIPSSFIASSN